MGKWGWRSALPAFARTPSWAGATRGALRAAPDQLWDLSLKSGLCPVGGSSGDLPSVWCLFFPARPLSPTHTHTRTRTHTHTCESLQTHTPQHHTHEFFVTIFWIRRWTNGCPRPGRWQWWSSYGAPTERCCGRHSGRDGRVRGPCATVGGRRGGAPKGQACDPHDRGWAQASCILSGIPGFGVSVRRAGRSLLRETHLATLGKTSAVSQVLSLSDSCWKWWILPAPGVGPGSGCH